MGGAAGSSLLGAVVPAVPADDGSENLLGCSCA